MNKLNFATIAGGGVEEKLQHALNEVAENIADPNTDAKKARKIAMTLTLKPNEQRSIVSLEVDVKTNLVPPVGISTTLIIDRDRDGNIVTAEIYGKDPSQGTINFDAEKVTDINERRAQND